ncbi:MAG: methyltransferase, partial [Gemmatimonadota bacterium]|nr:methyltransferase [Gemmatimonadota bacterium]
PEGGRLRLTLRALDAGVELFVEGGAREWRSGSSLLDDLPGLVAIWHRPSDEQEAVVVAGASAPGGGDAFEQVNEEAAHPLRAHVISEVTRGAPPPARVIDAYCGAGQVGRAVATTGPVVVGIEVNASAVAAARAEAPEGFTVVHGAVEEQLAQLLPADVLVLNPPRSGLDAEIPELIRTDPPDRIVYVSCDPATLARDVALLEDSFELGSVTCFDLFPHTAHVESVATLRRRRSS